MHLKRAHILETNRIVFHTILTLPDAFFNPPGSNMLNLHHPTSTPSKQQQQRPTTTYDDDDDDVSVCVNV